MTKKSESSDPMVRIQDQLCRLQDRLSKLEHASQEIQVDNLEIPPLPEKQGRRYLGAKRDLRVRIDQTLYDLLSMQADKEFGGNESACLDMVLWNFYGQPRLSFQANEADPA